jgi:hypothetical protein
MPSTPDKTLPKLKLIHRKIKICRDFYEGAIRVVTRDYLKKWDRETTKAWELRINSTPFPNLYSPIIMTLTGLITKKDPDIEQFTDLPMDNIDGKGDSFANFVKQVCESSIVAGVEFVSAESNLETNEVFLKRYRYEQLVTYQIEGNKLINIVFKEKLEVPDGAFGVREVERYIVFKIGGGEVWYDDDGNGVKLKEEWVNTLTDIPVVTVRTGEEVSHFDFIPRFYDIVDLNRVILNQKTQLANILLVMSNPIAVFYGNIDDEDQMNVGVQDALVFQDKSKEGLEFVEITGAGVTKLQDEIEKSIEAIDRISFGMLQKDSANTVIDAQENQVKSSSFLSDVAEELEVKFNRLLEFMALLSNKTPNMSEPLLFKKDFDDVLFSDQQLKMLNEMLAAGNLSRETFWQKLKTANLLPKDFDAEKEKELIGMDVV